MTEISAQQSMMKRLWEAVIRPAGFVMDRLKYLYKFLAIGVLILVPLGSVTKLQWDGATKEIRFNGKETLGVDYVEPTREFLYAVQRHRILQVAMLEGDTSVRPSQLEQITAEADKAVIRVDEVDAAYGGDTEDATIYGTGLKTTKRWHDARNAWNAVKGQRFANAADANKAHADLTAIAVDLILNYAANYSNLILDPDLDSYWLMDAFVGKMPTLTEAVSNAATMAITPGGNAAGQMEKVVELSGVYKGELSTLSDLESVNMATVFKEAPNFSKSDTVNQLKEPLGNAKSVLTGTAESIRRVHLNAKDASLGDNQKTVQDSLEALRVAHSFWQKVGPELRKECQIRVDNYKRQRTLGIGATLGGALLLIYLFIGFYASVRRAVATLGVAAERMIAGTSESFEVSSKDEVAQIAESFNQINAALVEARTLRDRVAKENADLESNIVDLLQVVSDASDGNLTVRARVTEGALGNVADAFNSLLVGLARLLGQSQVQLNRTVEAIGQVTQASERMAEGATVQASEAVSATDVVNKINVEFRAVSDRALEAAKAARRTELTAVDGEKAVRDVIEGMSTLRANVQAGAKKMKLLGDRSMEITSIVGTIARISEQTNMLALNAAIEAARAGEHGRGFSVVATEVRKLAERTAGATKEIDRLVKAIQAETSETVEAIERQTQAVEEQAELVGSFGESLGKIRQVSGESAHLIEDISKVALAQVASAGAVVKTVSTVSSIAKETQDRASGTAKIAGELINLSKALNSSMSRFRVNAA